MSRRLRRASVATGQPTEGIEIRESDLLESPVALGMFRPVILLPLDWNRWDGRKVEAVLAHERSHIHRHDQAVQALSAIHRALLWFSPLSWFLHQRLVRVGEEGERRCRGSIDPRSRVLCPGLARIHRARRAKRTGRESRWRAMAAWTSVFIVFWMARRFRRESRDGAWRRLSHSACR